MMDRTIAVRVEDALHKRIKIRLAENGMSLKDYIVCLIENELQDNKLLNPENIPANTIISEESVNEAQKVLDFARQILQRTKMTDYSEEVTAE